jgi:thiol-disulfide isomerase/thioredoxin
MIRPYLGRLEQDFPDHTFISIDRDKFIDLAKHLEIYGIPSFLVFQDGDEIARLVNKLRKTYQEVKTFIESTQS